MLRPCVATIRLGWVRIPVASHGCQHLPLSVSLIFVLPVGVWWRLTVASVSIPLLTDDVEQLLSRFVLCRFLCGESLFQSLACFFFFIGCLYSYYWYNLLFSHRFQFNSVQSLCNPMNLSTPGLPAHHQLPEFTQTHIHRVSDAIQPSHPLSLLLLPPIPPSIRLFSMSQLFTWGGQSTKFQL